MLHTQSSELIHSMSVNVPTALGTYVAGLVHFDVKWHWVHTSAGPWSLSGTVYAPLEIPLCTISTYPVIG